MWVMKITLDFGKQFLGRIALKHQVSMTGYPLSYYKDKKWLYVVASGLLFGEEKNKKALLRDFKKQDEVVQMEFNGDFGISITKQPLFMEPVYDPQIIRPVPIIINYKTKKHTWELASFNKQKLMIIFQICKKYLGATLYKLKQEKLSNISIVQILPDITAKQKQALAIAINNGYYDYPKKIKMETLAKIMNVSYSTYQAHLKKAEGKVLPSVYRNL